MALTYEDFEEFDYYKRRDEKPIRLAGTKATEHDHLRGLRLKITKSMLADGTIKEPKNFKKRTIPLDPCVERLFFIEYKHDLYNHDGLTRDGIAEAFIEFAKREKLSFF